jgi:predicted nucleic acid-binding protein
VRFLADTSAVWHVLRRQTTRQWIERTHRGLLAICGPVEAELMRSVRSERDFEPFGAVVRHAFTWVPAIGDPWRRIIEVQRDLIRIGHHRGPSVIDVAIALTAHSHGLTLVHNDGDFEAIAKVRPEIAMVRIDLN